MKLRVVCALVVLSAAPARAQSEPTSVVDATAPPVTTTVTDEMIANIPLGRTRDVSTTLNIHPSASADNFGTSIGGATSPENQVLIDGMSVNDVGFGLLNRRLVLDFVEQVTIKEGGLPAELGRATGGFIEAVTKSGGNEFHGTVFAYWRPGFLSSAGNEVLREGDAFAERRKLGHYVNTGAEIGGYIVKDKLWFHAGYAPEYQLDHWTRTLRARTADPNDNLAIRDARGGFVTSPIDKSVYDSSVIAHHFTAKLTHLVSEQFRHSLAVSGAPTDFHGVRQNDFDPLSGGGAVGAVNLANDPRSTSFDARQGNMSAIYRLAGNLLDGALLLDGSFGWSHDEHIIRPNAADGTAFTVYDERNYRDVATQSPGAAPGAERPECQPGQDFADGSSRCVVRNYGVNGWGGGPVRSLIGNRLAERFAVTHQRNLVGLHRLKAGVDFEQNGYHDRGEGDGALDASGNPIVRSVTRDTASHNWAAFAQDAWSPVPRLTISVGVRWEGQQLYSDGDLRGPGDKSIAIWDNWAPRASVSWDFLGHGRSKIFATFGRYYESVPLDLVDRSALWQVASGLKGQYSDETQIGARAEFLPSWVGGVTGIYRRLGRVIEDASRDGGGSVLTNPDGSGDDKPKRDYFAALVTLDHRFRNDFQLQLSYLLSFTHGNYAGLYDGTTNQLAPNHSTAFDTAASMVNRTGWLPQDQRHRVKLFGFYQIDLSKVGEGPPVIITPGVGVNVRSGLPIDALGSDPTLGASEVFLVTRGGAGRTPWVWSADLHTGLRYNTGPLDAFELTIDVFNVTNNQSATQVDNVYTFDPVAPLVDGKKSDLKHLRTIAGTPATANPNWGKPTQYQAPLSAQFGLRYTF